MAIQLRGDRSARRATATSPCPGAASSTTGGRSTRARSPTLRRSGSTRRRTLRQLVQEERPGTAPPEGAPDGFLAWRLARALGGRSPWSDTPGRRAETATGDGLLRSMPELSRRAMVSEPIERRFLRRLLGRRRKRAPAAPADRALYGSPLHRLRRPRPLTRVAFS